MSYEKIEDMLYKISVAVIAQRSEFATWVYWAIVRYVSTGRACTDWCKALCKADPDKLIAYCLKGPLTDDSFIKRCTAYLKRYCGYKPE